MLIKEPIGGDANLGQSCLLTGNTNGTAANYRWYNVYDGEGDDRAIGTGVAWHS